MNTIRNLIASALERLAKIIRPLSGGGPGGGTPPR